MIEDVRELLPLYALGILEPEEAAIVERALAVAGSSPALALELASYQRAADRVVSPVAPSPEVRARLLASIGGGRFEVHAERVCALFDVVLDRARELLGLIERTASWLPLTPGIAVVPFAGGPAVARADCGFLRIAPGGTFPLHGHVGEEAAIVLAGRVHDVTHERVHGPGGGWTLPAGTSHVLVCDSDVDCICAVRALDGIRFGGAAPSNS